MMFERFDTDSDGAVTKAELEGAAAAHFAEADANGDGLLSAEEMIAAAEKMRAAREAKRMADRIAKRIEAHDTDGDGMISLEEATAYMGGSRFDKMFDKLDADGDGSVTQAELEALKSTRGYGRNGRHDGHGRHWGHDRDNN